MTSRSRAGFVERDRARAIFDRMPEPIALGLRVAYAVAWRRREVFDLEWRNVDVAAGSIRLDTSKNGEPRTAYLPPELAEQLREHKGKVDALQKKLGRVVPDVFVKLDGVHAGRKVGSFRKRWAAACAAAGVPGLLVHDLRRSGVRNLVRAGVPERVAMAISGHKTRSVFDRYNITSEGDLRDAARRIAAPSNGHAGGDGHKSGHTATAARRILSRKSLVSTVTGG